jgi:hypothetical protein
MAACACLHTAFPQNTFFFDALIFGALIFDALIFDALIFDHGCLRMLAYCIPTKHVLL